MTPGLTPGDLRLGETVNSDRVGVSLCRLSAVTLGWHHVHSAQRLSEVTPSSDACVRRCARFSERERERGAGVGERGTFTPGLFQPL